MGVLLIRSRNPSSPMSVHKEEERRKIEVEEEVAKEGDNRRASLRGRIISTEVSQIEVDGNLEVEEEEVVLTGALTKGNPEWLAKPQIKIDALIAMSLDISQENAPRGIMEMLTLDHNSRKLFQVLMWFNPRCTLRCQFLRWLRFQCR